MNANRSARDARETDDDVVVRKAEHGWVVGGEEVSDLTSAMVLADLFAADHAAYEEGHSAGATAEASSGGSGGPDERRGDERRTGEAGVVPGRRALPARCARPPLRDLRWSLDRSRASFRRVRSRRMRPPG